VLFNISSALFRQCKVIS